MEPKADVVNFWRTNVDEWSTLISCPMLYYLVYIRMEEGAKLCAKKKTKNIFGRRAGD